MAVRFSGTSQYYSSTAGLPGAGGYTVIFWVRLVVDRDALSGIFSVAGGTSHTIQTQANGTTVEIRPSGGGGAVTLGSMTVGTWYKLAVTCEADGNPLTYTLSAATTISPTMTSTAAFASYPIATPTSILIGTSALVTTNWFNGRIAAFKMYDAVLTAAEIAREFMSYMPYRTTNLKHWHPFDKADVTDYSGNGATLTGGSGVTTEDGPPIPWRAVQIPFLAPDPAAVPWYAVYVTATGELFSIGDVYELQPDQSVKTYWGPSVDLQRYEWSTLALDFVTRAGYDLIDRVDDLLGEAGMAAVWADLSGGNSTTLQTRIATLLGPYRYRESAQPVDL